MDYAHPDIELTRYRNKTKDTIFLSDKIGGKGWFPFINGLLLSKDAAKSAFADFGRNFDPQKTFTTAMELLAVSEELNALPDSLSESEYVSMLAAQRNTQVQAFGPKTFLNYVCLITESSVDPDKFLHELLQNADDCSYSKSKNPPEFRLVVDGNQLRIGYSEDGFCKKDVRALTAIGESTKKEMVSKQSAPIGEKGIGFKSIFAIASSVEIDSYNFHFILDDRKIIVPRVKKNAPFFPGTSMTFTLKKKLPTTLFNKENLLSICMCLRKLKQIYINNCHVEIQDSEARRAVIIDGEEYTFDKITREFLVHDRTAVAERSRHGRLVSEQQAITCYTPINQTIKHYYLYCGLPTMIEAKTPIIIDAPFETSTSRDGVLQTHWNDIIRNEMYNAIISVIHARKTSARLDVQKYINEDGMFSSPYLCDSQFVESIAKETILPVIASNTFAAPAVTDCFFCHDVFGYLYSGNYAIAPSCIIDTYKRKYSKELLLLLGCKTIPPHKLLPLIGCNAHVLLKNDDSRKMMHAYLKEISNFTSNDSETRKQVHSLPIVPVKSIDSHPKYIAYSSSIYYSDTAMSCDDYDILDERLMDKDTFDCIFSVKVKEMNQYEIVERYRKSILLLINNPEKDDETLAKKLLSEFNTNYNMLSKCKDTLIAHSADIPMQFIGQQYYTGNKYTNKYGHRFVGKIVQSLVVAMEYEKFAAFILCKDICDLYPYDIDVTTNLLSENDIKDFLSDKFEHSAEIIRFYLEKGKITPELMEKYQLSGLETSDSMYCEDEFTDDFPSNPIRDNSHLTRIRNRIKESWLHPIKFVTRMISRKEPEEPIDMREYVLGMYSSQLHPGYYHCQKCRKVVPKRYVEVNNIQIDPSLAWKQMHLCLCVKCSKDYVLQRNIAEYYRRFIHNLWSAELKDEPIAISLGEADNCIYFTAVHLAEIQEILSLEDQNTAQ